VRVALHHFSLDSEATPYRLSSAALDRMFHNPTPDTAWPRFAGQRVRSVEVVVEMMSGHSLVVLRYVFNMSTFKSDGTFGRPRPHTSDFRGLLSRTLGSPASLLVVTQRFVS
jgi:hypothetical protein